MQTPQHRKRQYHNALSISYSCANNRLGMALGSVSRWIAFFSVVIYTIKTMYKHVRISGAHNQVNILCAATSTLCT